MRYSVLFFLHSRKTLSGRKRKTDQDFINRYEMMIKTSRGERSMVQDAVDQQLCVKVNSAASRCMVSWWDGADTRETPGNSMGRRTDLRERRKRWKKQEKRTKKMALRRKGSEIHELASNPVEEPNYFNRYLLLPLNPARLNQFVWVEVNLQLQSYRCD